MSKPAVIVDHLWKRYHKRFGTSTLWSLFGRRERTDDEFWALKDVSFEVQPGECLGIIGPNGSGKSTLLKILSRITKPTRGSIQVNGRVASLLEVGTGFHSELTGRENVFLSGAILGMKRAETRKRFDEIVAFSGVEEFIDVPVKRYSSGMYVRLAFAVAANIETDILIVDEVLAVGDAEFQKKCLGKMGDVGKLGRTVLFVSHNMTVVRAICNRCIWLHSGAVQETGESRKVVELYQKACAGEAERDLPVAERTRLPGYGTKARIMDVQVLAGGSVNPPTLDSRKPLRIRMIVEGLADGVRCCPELAICDGDTNLVFMNAGVMRNLIYTLNRGRHVFECEIERLNLFAGKYGVTATLSLPDCETIDRVPMAATIQIGEFDPYNTGYNIKKEYGFGLFHVEHDWRKTE